MLCPHGIGGHPGRDTASRRTSVELRCRAPHAGWRSRCPLLALAVLSLWSVRKRPALMVRRWHDAPLRLAQDPEKYQFVGCIDPERVTEVKGAVGQYRNEHASLAHFAAGHDAPLPHGEQWLHQHN